MIKFYALLICFLGSVLIAEQSVIKLKAQQEGWTYNELHPDYSTGLIKPQTGARKTFSYESLADVDVKVPEEFDLRGKIGPIRDQGNCGSCWAFSIIATLIDALMYQGGKPYVALSEQYMVDCARDMWGCGGGMPEAAKWITTPYGAPLLSDYPYKARNGRCISKPIADQALEWHWIGQEGRSPTVEEVKKAVYMYGPASVTVAVDNPFSGYQSGVFHGNSRNINHMTNIVGWSATRGGYWIMRNSWSKSFGMDGFMYIAYGANSIADEAIFLKVKEAPPMPVTREFGLESKNLVVKVTLKSDNKIKTEEARAVIQTFLNILERKN